MDANLQKKVKQAQPSKASGKQRYAQATKALHRQPSKRFAKNDPRSEEEQIFFSIAWDDAWRQFLERDPDGTFKYKTAKNLTHALAVGIDAATKMQRGNYLYKAVGPASNADKTKKIPYLGDWDILRSQTFLGEMRHDNALFGTPRMKVMREALREHIDVTHTAKDMAEQLLGWLARVETWTRQVDEFFEYKAFDKKLSLENNEKRFNRYMAVQTTLRVSTEGLVERILACYGVGKGGMDVLAQLIVASRLQGAAGDRAHEMILQGLSGVETLDGNATGGGVNDLPAAEDAQHNKALQLMVASFTDKAITYKMPHPELHIPGVPDVDDQESPRQHIKKTVEGMLPANGSGKKVN